MLLPCPQHALFLALPMSAHAVPLGVPQPCSRCRLAWVLRRQTCHPSSAADRMSAWLLGRRNDAHGAPILRNNGAARFCAVAFRGERSWVVTCYVEICRPDTQIDSPIDASAKIATIL